MLEKVRQYLAEFGLADAIRELPESSATVPLAAAALGVEEGQIAKTLAFRLGDRILLIVTAGDRRINNAAYRATFGAKARMLAPQETEAETGHAVGGVCPFAVNEGVEVYLDTSLRRFSHVFPACGSSNSAIELSVEQLQRTAKPIAWVSVSTPKESA